MMTCLVFVPPEPIADAHSQTAVDQTPSINSRYQPSPFNFERYLTSRRAMKYSSHTLPCLKQPPNAKLLLLHMDSSVPVPHAPYPHMTISIRNSATASCTSPIHSISGYKTAPYHGIILSTRPWRWYHCWKRTDFIA